MCWGECNMGMPWHKHWSEDNDNLGCQSSTSTVPETGSLPWSPLHFPAELDLTRDAPVLVQDVFLLSWTMTSPGMLPSWFRTISSWVMTFQGCSHHSLGHFPAELDHGLPGMLSSRFRSTGIAVLCCWAWLCAALSHHCGSLELLSYATVSGFVQLLGIQTQVLTLTQHLSTHPERGF